MRLRHVSGGSRRGRRFGFERLERREVLDGTVSVLVSAGNVTFIGDGRDNSVELFMVGSDVAYTDPNPTLPTKFVHGGPAEAVSPYDSAGAQTTKVILGPAVNKITFRMKGGNDTVILGSNLFTSGALSVRMDAGNDTVAIGDVDEAVGPNAVYSVASPNNPAALDAAFPRPTQGSVSSGGRITLDTGRGNDELHIAGLANAEQLLTISTGAGDDSVQFTAGTSAMSVGRAMIALGGGDNELQADGLGSDLALAIADGLTLVSGSGNDTIDLADVSVTGNVELRTGAGDDSLYAYNVTGDPSLAMNAGAGDDSVSIDGGDFSAFDVSLGTGEDFVMLGAVTADGATLDGGDGENTFFDLGYNALGSLVQFGFDNTLLDLGDDALASLMQSSFDNTAVDLGDNALASLMQSSFDNTAVDLGDNALGSRMQFSFDFDSLSTPLPTCGASDLSARSAL